jgi:hypothetical protein
LEFTELRRAVSEIAKDEEMVVTEPWVWVMAVLAEDELVVTVVLNESILPAKD